MNIRKLEDLSKDELIELIKQEREDYDQLVQELREALEQCRLSLEPYDDIKPRDWLTDREKLRRAHQAACAAMEQKHEL